MTSTSAFAPPGPTTRLADRRRFRQSLAGLAGAAVITAGASVGMASTAQAAAGDYGNPAQMDINNRFYLSGTSSPLTVPTSGVAAPYPAPITVTGVGGTITDVDVTLSSVSHTFPDDLDVLLVGPNGQQTVLMSDTGGLDDLTNTTLDFDDEAATGLPVAAQITTGRYQPTNAEGTGDSFPAPAPAADAAGSSLSVFDGADANGEWRLFVVDDAGGDAGSISGWRLSFDTTDGTQPFPSTVQVTGASGVVSDVDVALHGLQHSFPDDLDLMLVGPSGQKAMVMSDAGDADDVTGLELVLDDEAADPLPDATKLASGSFRPADYDLDGNSSLEDLAFRSPAPPVAGVGSPLTAFDGTDPNGAWQLYVVDDEQTDKGAIEGGWSLHITTTDPAPQTTPPTSPSSPSSPSSDASHPRVTGTAPKAGVSGVKRGANLKATLSEKVRKGTVTASTAKVMRKGSTKVVSAAVRYDATTRTVTVDPAAKLKAGTTYKVVVTTGVRDLAGNALDQKPAKTGLQKAVWSFTTR
jgi:subtilisin-like proprotein convertase family protein